MCPSAAASAAGGSGGGVFYCVGEVINKRVAFFFLYVRVRVLFEQLSPRIVYLPSVQVKPLNVSDTVLEPGAYTTLLFNSGLSVCVCVRVESASPVPFG